MNAPVPTHALLATDQLRAILDGAAAGMVVQDSTGRIVDCNPAAERLLGLSRDQMMGVSSIDPRWSAIDRDGREVPGDQHPSMRTLRSGQPIADFMLGVMLPGGARRWLTVSTNLLQRPCGAPWVVVSFVDVSAQRELEQALEAQRQALRAALDGSRTATWEWNVQTGETRFDERWAQIVGYRLEDLEPLSIDTWARLVHPDDLVASNAQLQRHFDGEVEYYDTECRMKHRDGGWRWVRDRGRVTSRTPAGRPLWMYGTHDDITERKQAEQVQARNHELMRALFELSPLGLQLVNIAQRRTEAVNDALVAITGYSREELIDGDPGQRFMPRWHAEREQWFAEAATRGRFGPAEVEYRHGSGRIINLVFSGVRVNDPRNDDYLWLSVQDVTAERALEQELRAAASLDRLTGLANRAAMQAELKRQIERSRRDPGRGLAVMFLDFDRFKLVNDTLGHDAGDELLCAIAQRLRAAAREAAADAAGASWLVARLGGDEFVVMAPGVADARQAGGHADALLEALAEPYLVKRQTVVSSASIGVALWHPAVASGDEMLRDADTAMYEAKRAGRGRWLLFDDTMRERLTRAVTIENELRHAVARGQLDALYQPIVDLETGLMTSAEALLRWRHPELGTIDPEEFLPLAEEARHVVAIGQWILTEACLQWQAWQRQDPAAAPSTVSVNLSRAQLALGTRLVQMVGELLSATGMPPSALQLEIAERDLMPEVAARAEVVRELAALGVKLAMDDFGSGKLSLEGLRAFPFSAIKIDSSFINGLSHDTQVLAIAHATINVIENLGMVSVAEGVEDDSEVATLQSLGCRCAQGRYFAPPMAAGVLLRARQSGGERASPAA